jgi:phosphocarrier protein HPr
MKFSDSTTTTDSLVGVEVRPGRVVGRIPHMPASLMEPTREAPPRDEEQLAGEALDASSVLSPMSPGAGSGDSVALRADGDGTEQVLDDLDAVLEHHHDQP